MDAETHSMSSSKAFNQSYAQLFVQLAGLAAGNIKAPFFAEDLPDQWDLIRLIENEKTPGQIAKAQGFYAKGPIDPASDDTVAVLALAIPWAELLNNYMSKQHSLAPPPAGLVAKGAPEVQFDFGLASSYGAVRAAIWANVNQIDSRQLYVVGHGPGGPLAQLAALDLRPDNKGPNKEPAPAAAPICYAFSTPAAGDQSFAQYYNSNVAESYTVWAGTADLPVDFFPTAPGVSSLYAPLGQAVSQPATLPAFDAPWWEHSSNFYLKALGGTLDTPPAEPGRVQNPPPNFSRSLADTLARLCSVAYQQRQHPNGTTINISPFMVKQNISSAGSVFCTLFTSSESIVAAFRSTVTWKEMADFLLNSFTFNADFIADNGAFVHQGALDVYTAVTDPTNDKAPPFREALITAIQKLSNTNTKLYITGHGFGGALANLAALDIATNNPDLCPAQIYTFGSTPIGTFEFCQKFQAKLGSNSFHVTRPGDFAPKLIMTGAYFPLDPQVSLTGAPKEDDYTQHPLNTYIALLDTRT